MQLILLKGSTIIIKVFFRNQRGLILVTNKIKISLKIKSKKNYIKITLKVMYHSKGISILILLEVQLKNLNPTFWTHLAI
jgi:hypothetical protein